MITIKDTHFTSDIALANILNVRTKAKLLEICKKLDLYVSPNQKKEETARRVARALLDNPIEVLQSLSKTELRLVDQFVQAGPNAYVTCKARKNFLKLQNYGLVLTYEDKDRGEWQMLMPDEVRESLATSYRFFLEMAEKGIKAPNARELRFMAMLNRLRDDGEE